VALEAELVAWLNQGIGRFYLLDRLTYLLVSDYFLPLLMCFWGLGMWFHGLDAKRREINQRAVLAGAIALGLANLVVLILNQQYFRERPFIHQDLANLLYAPTDSSFPANPAAVAFAFAMGVWLKNRRAAGVLIFLAALWSLVRVYNGLHYPSDVVAGGLIGVAVACLVTLGLRAIEPVPTWVLKGARSLHLA
jgi:undecaprenyl-diphosphatase